MKYRSSGVLLHLTSLFNPYPIGDLGPGATEFADFLAAAGQHWWQMLPVGPTGEGNSPYSASSAFAGNPLLLSPDLLVEQGFLSRQDVKPCQQGREGTVDFSAASEMKLALLTKAFENFAAQGSDLGQSDFDAFVSSESFWLDNFALFTAIQKQQGDSDWTHWPDELRTREPNALRQAQKTLARDIHYHQFVQWQFEVQWDQFRSVCASRRIELIGDIPLFVSHNSADVWAHPEIFKLDPSGHATVVAGVPPDYFSPTGQLWGVPVYRWDVLQDQDYRWWIERLRMNFRRFDVNRLDHFIGFVRTYEVPAEATTALDGQYQPGGGLPFFEAVREALGGCPFIAEDLGTVTPEVEELRDQLELPGIKVLQFELGSDHDPDPPLPEHHPAKSVVYTGTHDNDTSAGWYDSLPAAQREKLEQEVQAKDGDVVWGMICAAFASQADTAIIPAQDLLGLGTSARMNHPGVAEGNWGWRLQEGALTPELAQRLLDLTTSNGRKRSDDSISSFRMTGGSDKGG